MRANDHKKFEIAQLLLEVGADPDPRVSEYAKNIAVHFACVSANHASSRQYTESQIKALNKQGIEVFKAQNYQEAILLFLQVLKYWESVDKVANHSYVYTGCPCLRFPPGSIRSHFNFFRIKTGHISSWVKRPSITRRVNTPIFIGFY